MSRLTILILFVFLLEMLSAQTPVEPAIGHGTLDNPYQISSLENLFWIAARNDIVEDPDQTIRFASHYIQITDIDASDTANWFDGQGWLPIGDTITHFNGSYNGQGFVIDGLRVNNPAGEYVGLWGYTENAIIENLGLTDLQYYAASVIGGLAGYTSEETQIKNCYTTGTIEGASIESTAGGLTGESSYSSIEDSYSSVDINGYMNLGGLVAITTQSSIINSYSTGNITGITGSWHIGGLVGLQYYSTIEKCYNTGQINGTNGVGGLIGFRYFSSISDSYVTGAVSGNYGSGGIAGIEVGSTTDNCYSNAVIDGHYYSGGLVGYLTDQPPSVKLADIMRLQARAHSPNNVSPPLIRPDYSINNSYNTGIVNGSYYVGGLVGNLSDKGVIQNSYNTGLVQGTGHYTGGLAGGSYELSVIKTSYNSGDVSSTSDLWSWVGGITGENHNSSISNSYNTGNVNGLECTGGLVGEQVGGLIENSFSIGMVTSDTVLTGGLVGSGEGIDNNNYWNIETSGQTVSSMGEGRNTSDMTFPYSLNTYENWDFCDTWVEDPDYMMNDGYPYLRNIGYPVIIEEEYAEIYSPVTLSNYPNPFNPFTTILFSLDETVLSLDLNIYNIRGQLIRKLLNDSAHSKGEFQVVWDGKDDNGKAVTSGVYFCRLVTPRQTKIKKMILIK